jgi:hypothetical protein
MSEACGRVLETDTPAPEPGAGERLPGEMACRRSRKDGAWRRPQ